MMPPSLMVLCLTELDRTMFKTVFMAVALATLVDAYISSIDNGPECPDVRCHNNGVLDGEVCTCMCDDDYTGMFCETELQKTSWPLGQYSLLSTVFGCPEPNHFGWYRGYINLTLPEDKPAQRWKIPHPYGDPQTSPDPHLLGPYHFYSLQLNFCTRLDRTEDVTEFEENTTITWPRGNYCVFSAGQQCMTGFTHNSLTIVGYAVSWEDVDGVLPNVTINRNSSELTLSYCCLEEEEVESDAMRIPSDFPFILMKKNNTSCSPVHNMTVTEERFDLVDDLDRFRSEGQDELLLEIDVYQRLGLCYYANAARRECFYPDDFGFSYAGTMNVSADGRPCLNWYDVDKSLIPGIPLVGDFAENYCRIPNPWTPRPSVPLCNVNSSDGTVKLVKCNITECEIDTPFETVGLHKPIYAVEHLPDRPPQGMVDGDPSAIPFRSERPKQKPWVQVDLEEAFEVHSVLVYRKYRELPFNELLGVSSGSKLFTRASRFRFMCYRPIQGQFVTIRNFDDPDPENTWGTFFSLEISEITVFVKRKTCMRRLGILSGEVRDFQLSGSSDATDMMFETGRLLRPGSGWCVEDPNDPYFMVDLIVPTVVSGLEIQGWMNGETVFNVVQFTVDYAVHENSLRSYLDPRGRTKIFSIDQTLPPSMTKRVMFYKSFVARYVKLNIMKYRGNACLKLELIGCPKRVSRDLVCGPGTTFFGYDVMIRTAYWMEQVEEHPVNDTTVCLELCSDRQYCVGAYVTTKSCSILNSTRYNPHYIHWYVPDVSHRVSLATKLCVKDIKDARSCSGEMTEPGTLESPSYPFYYGQLVQCVWKLRFPEGRYVQIRILDLELPIADSLSILRENGVFDVSPGDCIDTLTIDDLAITSTNENMYKNAVIVSRASVADVTLNSCARYSLTDARGFMLDVSYSDSPGCWSNDFKCSTICEEPAAVISSPTYPAGISPSSSCRWNIRGTLGQFVLLSFKVIDILDPTGSCEVSYVIVLDESLYGTKTKIDDFCSFNFPIDTLKSSWQFMEIQFVTGEVGSGNGFMAEYTLIDYIQNWNNQTNFENDTGCDDWELYGDSCYQVIGDVQGLTWLAAENQCKFHGAHLVSLTSKQETSFIHSVLIKKLSNTTSRETDFYIGLRKVGNGGRFVDFVWSDGSPLTYTAWYRNESSGQTQPDGLENERCTRVKLYSIHSTNNWHDVACAFDKIRMFICEKPNSRHVVKNNTMELSFPLIPPRLIDSVQYEYFRCNSSEFILNTYWCDGHIDCLDGSDEILCAAEDTCLGGYQCNNGQCVSAAAYCDFREDCLDGSDERECVHAECLPLQWKCSSGQCVSEDQRCDVKTDCFDGSDEANCDTCQANSFQCYDQRCIPQSRVCDTYNDCSGRFYEEENQNCSPPSQPSCVDWYKLGRRNNGSYQINLNTKDVFEVECRFSQIDVGSTTTVLVQTLIHHAYEARITWKEQWKHEIAYGPTEEQLEFLKARASCRQHLSVECSYTTGKFTWYGLSGTSVTNFETWDGCSCPYVGKCAGTEDRCNCSQITNKEWYGLPHDIFLTDSGFITLENHLPIVALRPGMLGTSFLPAQRSTLGPLICEEEITDSGSSSTLVCENNKISPNNIPCVLDFDAYGETKGCRDLSHLDDCTHFQCPENHAKCSDGYCIPFYRVCDGTMHCSDGGDEMDCAPNSVCEGGLRCRQSDVCVPLDHVCDDFVHCQLGDDERFCDITCPSGCDCFDVTIFCDVYYFIQTDNMFLEKQQSLRILLLFSEVSSYEPEFNSSVFDDMPYLIHLDAPKCGIKKLNPYQFQKNANLIVLDLSYNLISVLYTNTFQGLGKLERLLLEGNPIQVVQISAFEGLVNLPQLDLSNSDIGNLFKGMFSGLQNVVRLNISDMNLEYVESGTFSGMSSLKTLDIRGNKIIDFEEGIFTGLDELDYLFTSAFTLCCLRPTNVKEENCLPSKDEFSSCDDLMRNQVLRAFLWIIGTLALLGNIAVLIYRFIVDRESLGKTYGVFVSNLSMADFLMGVYLIILASADTAFRGTYVWNDHHWRNGTPCKIAGVLSTLGSEGSVIFLCLITFDRLLVVKFPFGNVRITRKVSLIISLTSWIILFVLALVPLNSGEYFQGVFYARSAVCLPLPLTRDRPAGWEYSIGVFIVFNLLAFIWIALGQIAIYREIYISRGKTASRGRRHDITIARNLLMVAVTDFLCWFPVGVMGMMALSGNVISGEVYAWIAVFVLPINSALNPFIYTIGATLSKSRSTGKKSSKRLSTKESNTITGVFRSGAFHFASSRSIADKITLNELTSMRGVTVKESLAVALRIVRSLHMLHCADLVHGSLTADKVFVKVTKRGLSKVTLVSSPKSCVEEEDLFNDVNAFGETMKLLLKYTKTK